jgi:hypothetical protein
VNLGEPEGVLVVVCSIVSVEPGESLFGDTHLLEREACRRSRLPSHIGGDSGRIGAILVDMPPWWWWLRRVLIRAEVPAGRRVLCRKRIEMSRVVW